MMPYSGSNPYSVIIMDNCSVHHISKVKDALHQAGILVFFIPLYIPDLNPIEEAFKYIKYLEETQCCLAVRSFA